MSTQPNEDITVTNAAAPRVIDMPKRKKNRGYYIVSQKDVIAACNLVRANPHHRERWYARKLGIKARTFVRLLHRLRIHKVNLDVPRLVVYKYSKTKGDYVPPYERKVLTHPNRKFIPKQVPVGKGSPQKGSVTKPTAVRTPALKPVRLTMSVETLTNSRLTFESSFPDTKNLGKWLSEFAKTLSI